MVRVMGVPDGVVKGAESVTVPLAGFPDSKRKLVGEVESKSRLLVARMVKFPPVPVVTTEKGTENGFPGTKMLSAST